MKKRTGFLSKLRLENSRIGVQMLIIYALVLLIPLSVLGVLLMQSGSRMLTQHSIELLEADNHRVRTLMSEVTDQVYSVSDDICFDNSLRQLLAKEYDSYAEFVSASNSYSKSDTLLYNNRELDSILIFTDNPTIKQYKLFRPVTEEIAAQEWYIRSQTATAGFWISYNASSYGNNLSNLCLVRRILLPGTEYQAVVLIRISDSYIRSRIDSGSVVDAISLDGGAIVYSSRRGWYNQALPVAVDTGDAYFRYSGSAELDSGECLASVTTLKLNKTNSRLYICTLDSSGLQSLRRITFNWLILLIIALVVPGVVLTYFTFYVSRRVKLLREEMRKASSRDYDITGVLGGSDELAEAFADLKTMVQDIKEQEAKVYEAELRTEQLRTRQQAMEYKVLASQINPHYLYNTLETIRMKALTSGNRELADCVKILGKTLHYVQTNTGAAFTTLAKEIEHVENYLTIQKLRFGDRINYTRSISAEVDPSKVELLPLLVQPVVENAVVHGLETVEGVGTVRLEITREDNTLCIAVRDSGRGIPAGELARIREMLERPEPDPGDSVALYNIHRRLRLCYGPGYGLALESKPGEGTCVTIRIPADGSVNI